MTWPPSDTTRKARPGRERGALAAGFAGSAAQVAIQLVLQEAVHVVAAVLLLHDHQGGVLGERLGHHVGAFDASSDELVPHH